MKVLVKQGGSKAADILTLTYAAGDFEGLVDGVSYEGKGVVAEVPDGEVKAAIAKAARRSDFMDAKDFNRDLKFIAQVCSDYKNGTEVAAKGTDRGFQLVPDASGRINRAENLSKGDRVAVGPNISPKALMNARGRVVSINGKNAGVELEDGDLDRVRRATGKTWANPVKLPKATLEKVA